ncbi:Polyribonucleotide nucleotidyltransferase 1, mitochondrial, partial [Operophtera brumata]
TKHHSAPYHVLSIPHYYLLGYRKIHIQTSRSRTQRRIRRRRRTKLSKPRRGRPSIPAIDGADEDESEEIPKTQPSPEPAGSTSETPEAGRRREEQFFLNNSLDSSVGQRKFPNSGNKLSPWKDLIKAIHRTVCKVRRWSLCSYLRPLFPSNYFYDTQIVCNMLAVDGTNLPETVAVNAASAALALSDVPLGLIDNEIIINPTRKDLEKSGLNLVVTAAKSNLVVMLEGGAQDILQQDLLKAIKLGTKEAQHIVRGIETLQKKHGRMKREYESQTPLEQSVVDSTVLNQLRDTEADVTQLQDCFNAHLRQTFRDMIFETDSFFLHYEFPSYATGEVGRTGPAGRREAGHGALAERGLLPIVPNQSYTTRLTAEVLESNGSSSMASVCGGSLALLDAGVPVSAAAAGVAIGLGITALQADIKVSGLPLKVVMESVQKACDAKSKIIDIMNQCIDKPRTAQAHNGTASRHQSVRAAPQGSHGVSAEGVTPIDETKYSVFAPS